MDIDLDYFNNSLEWKIGELHCEDTIRSVLYNLKNFTEWDLVTVAISPDYSGTKDDTLYLLSIFLGVFEIDFQDLINWNISNLFKLE